MISYLTKSILKPTVHNNFIIETSFDKIEITEFLFIVHFQLEDIGDCKSNILIEISLRCYYRQCMINIYSITISNH